MRKNTFAAISLGLVLALGSCNSKKEDKILTREITFSKEGEIKLLKASNDSVLVQLDIEIAETDYETQTGLMYRKGMENNQGMFFLFDNESRKSFYMKNTEFPLDIIYINSQFKVVNIHKNTVPFDKTPLPSSAPVQYVLEVNAGLADVWALEPGDQVNFERQL